MWRAHDRITVTAQDTAAVLVAHDEENVGFHDGLCIPGILLKARDANHANLAHRKSQQIKVLFRHTSNHIIKEIKINYRYQYFKIETLWHNHYDT
jgi:hypothetical protein